MKKLFLVILVLTNVFPAFAQTKVVTNQDLEKYRVKRIEAAKELREKYAEMGYSSPEEAEKAFAEKRARARQYVEQLERENADGQNEIIAQANALRLEIASVEAQINYLRGQMSGFFSQPYIYSYGYAPFDVSPFNYPAGQKRRLPPRISSPRELNPVIPNGSSVAVPARRPNMNNPIWNSGNRRYYGRRGFYRGGYVVPVIVGGSYNANDVNAQLISLEQHRAGLLAQWRILEDRARRAGIKLD